MSRQAVWSSSGQVYCLQGNSLETTFLPIPESWYDIYKINDIIIVYHQPLQDIFQWSSQYLNTVLEVFFLTKGAFEEVIFFFFFFSQKITLHYAILFLIYYFLRGHKQYHGKWSKQIVRHQTEKNKKHAIVIIKHPQVSAKAFSVNIFQYEDVTSTQEGL